MAVITIFSANFCEEEAVAKKVAEELGYKYLGTEIIREAAKRHNMPEEKLLRALHGAPSIFNSFTREKEKGIAYIQEAFAEAILEDDVVYLGFAMHLMPPTMSHVLKVCLLASKEHRMKVAAMSGSAASKKDAQKTIKKNDLDIAQWMDFLKKPGPWDAKLYDIKIPMHESSVDAAAELICQNAKKEIMKATEQSLAAAADFALASRVKVTLAEAGHFVDVECSDSEVTMIINRNVLRLEPLEKELESIAVKVDGVKSASSKVGPQFHEANIYRRQNFELPSKVLLVDDETEFVQTLSERLQMRDFGTAVASTGEQALEMVLSDEPEVMVLDLRMPGINGMEVLQRMKKTNPAVEVIILTGHGTDKDRDLAMGLGAFAYLEKPVDIELLSKTMKEAHESAQQKASGKG